MAGFVQELRVKVSLAGQQQSEMLRRAQDICMEAEERADAAERKTTKVRNQYHERTCVERYDMSQTCVTVVARAGGGSFHAAGE